MFRHKSNSSSGSKSIFQHTKFITYLRLDEIECHNESHLTKTRRTTIVNKLK